MHSLKIKQKYFFLVVLLLILGGCIGLYWKGLAEVLTPSVLLPPLASPAKTYVFLDSRNGEILQGYTAYETLLSRYEALIDKASSSKEKNMAQYLIGHLYYDLHEMTKAQEYLLPLLICDDGALAIRAGEVLAAIAYQNGALADVETMVNLLQERYPDQQLTILQSWKANAMAKAGLPGAAFQLYDTLIQNEKDGELRRELSARKQNLSWQIKKGKGTIEGYVEMVTGQKLANIPVYLTNTAGSNTVTPSADLPITYTDQDGYYVFRGLAPGMYNVGIELRQDLFSGNVTTNTRGRLVTIYASQSSVVRFKIHPQVTLLSPKPGERIGENAQGKVIFRWKPLEGAAYYIFSIASYYQLPENALNDSIIVLNSLETECANGGVWNIFNPKGLVPIYDSEVEINFYAPFEYISRQEFSAGFIVPNYVLNWVYPGSKILWRVQAYDQNGNLIGDSNNQIDPTFKPYIVFEEGELRPGDQELLDGKYVEALEIYLHEVHNNPDDKFLQAKVRDLVTSLKNFYSYSSSNIVDVLQRLQNENQIPEELLHYILTKFETKPIWEMAIQGFILGVEKPEVPLSWKIYFEPVVAELDAEELSQIRGQILERSFDPRLEQMKDASLTRLIMGFYYRWLVNQSFRDSASEEYNAYAEAILAQSGKWYDSMKRFLTSLSVRKENYANDKIPK